MNRLLQSVYRLRIQSIQSLIKVNIPKEKDTKLPYGILKYDDDLSICKKSSTFHKEKLELDKEERIVNC